MTDKRSAAGGAVVSAWVSPEVAERLAELAAEGDRSVSREAGRALRAYVAANEPEVSPAETLLGVPRDGR